MTVTEPEVYSTPDTVSKRKFPKEWKLCPLINDGCYGGDCKFWVEDNCLLYKLLIKLLVYD